MQLSKQQYLDLLERVVWTFIQAFGAFVILKVTDIAGSLDWGEVLIGALIAGGIAVLKCLVGFQVGNTQSAAVLPGAEPDA